MTYHVYILQSNKDGGYYIGITNNLERRLREHNLGYNRSTKPRRTWLVVYTETHLTLSEAKLRESAIKNKKVKNQ